MSEKDEARWVPTGSALALAASFDGLNSALVDEEVARLREREEALLATVRCFRVANADLRARLADAQRAADAKNDAPRAVVVSAGGLPSATTLTAEAEKAEVWMEHHREVRTARQPPPAPTCVCVARAG